MKRARAGAIMRNPCITSSTAKSARECDGAGSLWRRHALSPDAMAAAASSSSTWASWAHPRQTRRTTTKKKTNRYRCSTRTKSRPLPFRASSCASSERPIENKSVRERSWAQVKVPSREQSEERGVETHTWWCLMALLCNSISCSSDSLNLASCSRSYIRTGN